MAEYIKREYAVDAVLDVYYDTPDIDLSGEKFETAIFKIPAADVVPVRHGQWEQRLNGEVVCSRCGALVAVGNGDALKEVQESQHFCFNCGAKMDG